MFNRLLHHFFCSVKDTNPEPAYNLWAGDYDNQPDNLMLALDEALFTELLLRIELTGKIVADIGCGTGRHWQKLMDKQPATLVGFDVSEGMLAKLRRKFPQAITHHLKGNKLAALENRSCHLLISTLTIAHIEDPAEALREWERVLKPGGEIIITDYHPLALANGGKRTFKYNGQVLSIKNYSHPIEKIISLAEQLGLKVVRCEEKKIDEPMRVYYERQNAVKTFEVWKGIPVIYGIHLKSKDDTA